MFQERGCFSDYHFQRLRDASSNASSTTPPAAFNRRP
jgi:hypothetical protein